LGEGFGDLQADAAGAANDKVETVGFVRHKIRSPAGGRWSRPGNGLMVAPL
jgi:hypothetical protein